MPAYQTPIPPGQPPQLLTPGLPGYAFGSRATGSSRLLQVTNVSLTSNVATLNVTMREGNIPAVGDLISVRGTSGGGGAFNITNVALTGVTITPSTGQGTVTFALTHADVASTPDAGQAYIPVPETAEALANGSSRQFAVQPISKDNTSGRTITWTTNYPSAPGGVTMALQAALVDLDSEYQTVDSSTNTTGEERYVVATNFNFLRLKASGVSGGSNPTVIAKIQV